MPRSLSLRCIQLCGKEGFSNDAQPINRADLAHKAARGRSFQTLDVAERMSQPPKEPMPLRPLDARGRELVVGDRVLIREIPHWLTHNLPPEDTAQLQAQAGSVQPIRRFDAHGYAWFGEDAIGWFCLRPNELERVGSSADAPA